nr:unnamed protein product [Callosobruchus analis]
MEDLLHALFFSSDMVISALRPLPKRKLSFLSKEVINLLHVPEIPAASSLEEDSQDTSLSENSESEMETDL